MRVHRLPGHEFATRVTFSVISFRMILCQMSNHFQFGRQPDGAAFRRAGASQMHITQMFEQVRQMVFHAHAVIAPIRATEMTGHVLQQVTHVLKCLITLLAVMSFPLISMEVITFLETGLMDQQTGFCFECLFALFA